MAKKLTQREAWLFLAEKWGGAEESEVCPGDYKIEIGGQIRDFGICTSITSIQDEELVSYKTADLMRARIDEECSKFPDKMFLFPTTKSGAKKRAALCRLFADKCVVAVKKPAKKKATTKK